ncbi:hypothetical protein GGR50DRAFT_318234 [Xylaria sp. CBS 124048]|nr:hypothetical protein GGR50DRAFT_318234 [Xylaria sp. CBS 124048]
MQLPRSVLPSQKYAQSSDYAFENHHEGMPSTSTRQPLGESNVNIQAHGLPVSADFCYNQFSLPPSIHSIPAPPILPTQALTPIYGTSLRSERTLHRNVSLRDLSAGDRRVRKNPIYHHKNFADYRNKVLQKERDEENPVWPDWLEVAFLDALLLIPQLGRKKFSANTVLYGRNMLITEYLWIYHWTLHPPAEGEVIPNRKEREKSRGTRGHPMFRSRKQVSSHIQVLKGFFPTLPTFHFVFPRQKDGLDDDRKAVKEDVDTESFKNNRVLISITNGRLPDEKPNYEYFKRLLNAENDVFIRPKTCWIFVSSSKVTLKERLVASDDGTMKKQLTGKHPDGLCLTEEDYPHLNLNEGKDCKELSRRGGRPVVLLHEYTRTLAQKESSSVKDISNKWDVRFPDLRHKLTTALEDTRPSDERTSRCVVGPCDTFHFETIIDLHSTSKFPSGSDMNGLVEFSINRPDLHSHIWRSRTCVIKPGELYMPEEEDIWEQNNPIEVTPSHRSGCSGIGRCDCVARGNRDSISIPFPASSWANTFIKLAPFVTAEKERKDQQEAATSQNGRTDREASRAKKDKADSSSEPPSKVPSPKDLLAQVAMYQEIWSAPQGEVANGNGDEDSIPKRSRGKWTRRAVVLWTFVPVYETTDDKGKTTAVPPGTNWRFLTKVDPTSSYHQQRAYVSGSSRAMARTSMMSPDSEYAQHINTAMHENMSAAYDASPTTAFTLPSHTHGQIHHIPQQTDQLTELNEVFEGYSNGLTTPPLSAPLPNGYSRAFDNNHINIDSSHTLHHRMSFMSDRTSGTNTTDHTHASFPAGSDPNHHNEPFMSGLDVPGYIPNFQPPSSTDALGQLNHRYMDAGQGISDASVGDWVSTNVSPTSSTAGQQWATAAVAAATAGNTQHQGLGESHADLSAAGGVENQGTWNTWQGTEVPCIPPSYSRGTSGSMWDEGTPEINEGENTSSSFTLGGTGMTSLRNHKHMHHPPLHGLPLASQATQRRSSPTLPSRKRSRTESAGLDVDGDGEEGERYHAHSVRKLSHQATSNASSAFAGGGGGGGGGSGSAPTAVMGEVSANLP